MRKAEFEKKYLNKMIEVTVFDGDIYKGCLRKTGDKNFKFNPNLYLIRDSYFFTEDIKSLECISCIFRFSHIRKIKELV